MTDTSDDIRAEVASLVAETQRHLLWLSDSDVTTLKRADATAAAPAVAPPPAERFRPSFARDAAPPKPAPAQATHPAPVVSPAVAAPPPQPVERTMPPPAPPPASMTAAASAPPTPVVNASDNGGVSRLAALRAIRQDLGRCERCTLSKTRNSIVWGQGNPEAELVFVGEAPGEDEDLSGIPFVGKAGQLLTRMIEAMGLTRDDVYICNILKCRPPGNRTPEADEVDECRPFVERQLLAIKPKVIVVMGNTAAKSLLRTNAGITSIRNKWQDWNGIPVMPTFHPSYLLRDATEKPKAWDDLKLVMAKLGISPRK